MTVEQLREWLKDKPANAVVVLDDLDETACTTGYYMDAFPHYDDKNNHVLFDYNE